MNTNNKILGVAITIIMSIVVFFLCVSIRDHGDPRKLYSVYLNGDKIGLIEDKQELLDLIDKEQVEIKEEYNVDKVYPPSGLDIQKVITYDDEVISTASVYEKIRDIEPFTISGYKVTITYKEPEEKKYEPDRMLEVRGRLMDNTYIYKGDVRRNERLRAPGNLLILGDVDKNAEVVAIGSIYVFGKVRGRIWAGCNGDDEASIIATGLMPDEMRISDVYLRLPNVNLRVKNRPERAYLLNNTICIDEY